MPDHWGARFELVVANILEGPLRELAPNLSRALTPGGVLLLSGFTPLQIPSLKVPFTEHGLSYISESMLDGWALLMFRRSSK
jgi:ribosomal protein L11 methyltransferase